MLSFVIDLPLVSWMAPRLSRFRCYDPREADKRAVRYLLKEQYKGLILDKFITLHFTFLFKIPASYSKKKRQQIEIGELFPTRLDCTNMQKLYEDCLKGIVIKDDRKVYQISSTKLFTEGRERALISVLGER